MPGSVSAEPTMRHQGDGQQAVHDAGRRQAKMPKRAVGQNGQDDGGDAADDAGELAGLDRVGAQRWADACAPRRW